MRVFTGSTVIVAVVLTLVCVSFSGVPRLVNYQGVLTDIEGLPVDGSHDLTFRIYGIAVGGDPLWEEPHPGADVRDGVFSVILGSEAAMPVELFAGEELWLGVQVGTGPEIVPRTRITPVPWALRAGVADMALRVSEEAYGEHSVSRDALSTPGSINDPSNPVDWTKLKGVPPYLLEGFSAPDQGLLGKKDGWKEKDKCQKFGDNHSLDAADCDPMNVVYVNDEGHVGVGTLASDYNFEISCRDSSGGLKVSWGDEYPWLRSYLGYPAVGGLVINSCSGGGWADIDLQSDGISRLFVESGGNVGVGTISPTERLEVNGKLRMGDNIRLDGHWLSGDGTDEGLYVDNGGKVTMSSDMVVRSSDTDNRLIQAYASDGSELFDVYETGFGASRLRLRDGDGGTCVELAGGILTWNYFKGAVGIGVEFPTVKLEVAGRVKCGTLELTGGSDIAEPFDVTHTDGLTPGMVLSIDPENPGALKISSEAYDRCVAGIVSGAGDVEPGMIMSQSGSVADGEYPIALSGRVYCWADAAAGSIQPGDLLTTSETPGHAMRAADSERSHGAVIGKAMTPLEQGKGLVLVLVNLQ